MTFRNFFLIAVLFLAIAAQAAIPPSRMIFQRLVDNAGTGAYTVEQEVLIPNGSAEPLALKETWVVDNDRSLRVTVTPMQDSKDSVRLQILYAGGQRWTLKDGSRQSSGFPVDFAEKPFHLRSLEAASQFFQSEGILPANALSKRPLQKKNDEFVHKTEDFVRLARAEGVIAWAFGQPAPEKGEMPPGLWVEQDQFVIRRLRFPDGAEVTADSYSTYARGLQFPRERTIRWGSQIVTIRLLSVTGKGPSLTLSSLDTPTKIHGLQSNTQSLIEEFYSRFR